MKKFFYLILVVQLLTIACNNTPNDDLIDDLTNNSSDAFEAFIEQQEAIINSYENICPPVTDAIDYPEPWTVDIAKTFVIPDETINSMSTCGLLATLLEHPENGMFRPWCTYCSNSELPGVTMLNDELRENKVAVELFKRDDYFSVLASKYLTIIEKKEYYYGQTEYFEMLLASDMCMSMLNENEKIQLMVMALKKATSKSESIGVNETCHIMVAVMQSCNYILFKKDVGTKLRETSMGYSMDISDDIMYLGLNSHSDIIVKYAKKFLNEKM
ncbi:MAG: hypothetical protein LBV47_03085 [Bacteroidales bacterium]|jgi:hypothetical protein|nr:hypothetical protein [Bacteroidales bacterium]